MDREHWKKMLPIITAFTNGERITWLGDDLVRPTFQNEPSQYLVAPKKEKIPLEAEDWIKDGPWWVRSVECPDPFLLINAAHKVDMKCERRNAASDWMPCWKEKE